MTQTCVPRPRRSALTGVLFGACVLAACSVSTSIGAVNEDGSASAERPPNSDRTNERWPLPEGRDGNGFPSGRNESWFVGNGTPCNLGRAQSCDGVGEFCDAYGSGCAGGEGVCGHVVPENCPAPTPFSSVCGCDNQTYESDCRRMAARVQLQYRGACKSTP